MGDHLISPRTRYRLDFEAIEARSVLRNVPVNRESTYGINFKIGDNQTYLLSPRSSNRLDVLDMSVKRAMAKRALSQAMPGQTQDDDASSPQREEMDEDTWERLNGLVSNATIENEWEDQWPDEWLNGKGKGIVPEALNTLKRSQALVGSIEKWLVSENPDVEIPEEQQQSQTSEKPKLKKKTSSVIEDLPLEEERPETASQSTQTMTTKPIRSIGQTVALFRKRLLETPLLSSVSAAELLPPEASRHRSKQRTNGRKRSSSSKILEPLQKDASKKTGAAKERSRSSKRTRQSKETYTGHKDFLLVDNEWQEKQDKQKSKVVFENLKEHREIDFDEVLRAAKHRSRRKRRRKRSSAKKRPATQPSQTRETYSDEKRPATKDFRELRRPRSPTERLEEALDMQERLGPGNEAFVKELELRLKKQMGKGRKRGKKEEEDEESGPLILEEPEYEHHFLKPSFVSAMQALPGAAQRYLYLEARQKEREKKVKTRVPRKEAHDAWERVREIKYREEMMENQRKAEFVRQFNEFNMDEAVKQAKARLASYEKEIERMMDAARLQAYEEIPKDCEVCAKRFLNKHGLQSISTSSKHHHHNHARKERKKRTTEAAELAELEKLLAKSNLDTDNKRESSKQRKKSNGLGFDLKELDSARLDAFVEKTVESIMEEAKLVNESPTVLEEDAL